jgi:sugar lactone lactonase YvrE
VKSGRVFVNFPYWASGHTISVAEIIDGKAVPFPDAAWNTKDGAPDRTFVCVQSVVVDSLDNLWALDAGSPLQTGVVKGAAKLVKIGLAGNTVEKTISFSDEVAPKKSYLNDMRFTADGRHAFITESGIGSLIVVDLRSGNARRVLSNHPSTKVEPQKILVVDGLKPIDPETKGTPQFHADGIALDEKGGWLYYHALTANNLYRVSVKALADETLTEAELAEKVEKVGITPAPDGMLEGKDGRIYLAAFEMNSVVRFDPSSGNKMTVIEDEKLQWPDTLAWGPKRELYVTTSQIHRVPKYNAGKDKRKGPFALYRIPNVGP